MERWKGRVALVTGASSGLGAGICKELVKHGMTVVGCARRVQKIRDMAEEDEVKASPGRLVAVQCDVTKETDVLAMFEEIRTTFGRIDVCVNSAGIYRSASLTSGKTEDWRNMFEVNVLAMSICSRESVKLMREKGIDDGQIIQIGSIVGHVMPPEYPGIATAYACALKAMVRALTEGLRREITASKSHIRVACVSAGSVKDTGILDSVVFQNKLTAKAAIFSTGQWLVPKDVADCVVHILKSPPHVDINDVILRCVEETF